MSSAPSNSLTVAAGPAQRFQSTDEHLPGLVLQPLVQTTVQAAIILEHGDEYDRSLRAVVYARGAQLAAFRMMDEVRPNPRPGATPAIPYARFAPNTPLAQDPDQVPPSVKPVEHTCLEQLRERCVPSEGGNGTAAFLPFDYILDLAGGILQFLREAVFKSVEPRAQPIRHEAGDIAAGSADNR